MKRKVTIDQDECLGCEACVGLCPSLFRFNDELCKAEVIEDGDPTDECVDDAIASCPADCIHKEE